MRVFLLACAAVLAGCFAPADPAPETASAPAATGASAPPFVLNGSRCMEGGGHSVHPKLEGYLPEPWLPADVQEDTGTPPLTTEFWGHPDQSIPGENDTMGNWHVTMSCEAWDLDGEPTQLLFGYVGMRIEPPPFDDSPTPAARHYLVTVVATSDAGLQGLLHAGGFHATLTAGQVAIESPLGIWHTILDTEDHGIYESIWRPKEAGEMPAGIVRLWFQKENEDGTFSPIALDLVTTKPGARIQADGYGWFSHLGTADHSLFGDLPVLGPIPPGAGGETPALAYTGFDRQIVLGATPDVKLQEAYIHL